MKNEPWSLLFCFNLFKKMFIVTYGYVCVPASLGHTWLTIVHSGKGILGRCPFELVGWVKQMCLPGLGDLQQSREGLTRIKRWQSLPSAWLLSQDTCVLSSGLWLWGCWAWAGSCTQHSSSWDCVPANGLCWISSLCRQIPGPHYIWANNCKIINPPIVNPKTLMID